jgi:hypothetical protein
MIETAIQIWVFTAFSLVVAVKGAATIPGDKGGPAEAERAKPMLPGARQEPESTRARGS